VKRVVLALLLASCGGGESITAPSTPTLSMEPAAWTFRYSLGMGEHPVAALNGGWQFDFPMQDGVHYLTTPMTADLRGKEIQVTAHVVGIDPVFAWPADACGSPARARVMAQRQGDDLRSASGRWWSDRPITLQVGATTITAPVSPERWSNVDGKVGTADPQGFDDAMAHPGFVGLTFGGGCFFGHGVWLQSGAARMLVRDFSIQ